MNALGLLFLVLVLVFLMAAAGLVALTLGVILRALA